MLPQQVGMTAMVEAMQQAVASGSYGIHALLYARFRQAEHDQRV